MPSLVAVACFLPRRAKDLSAPPRSSLSTADRKALNVSSIDDLWHFSNISYVFTIHTGLGTGLVTESPTNSFGTPTRIQAFKGLHCCNLILHILVEFL